MAEDSRVKEISIYSKFKEVANQNAARPVVYWKENQKWQSKNFAEFLELVDRLAGGFGSLGVKINTNVAILSENRYEWLATDLALNKLGAVSVPIHAAGNLGFIECILQHSHSEFLVVSKTLFVKHRDWLRTVEEKIRLIEICRPGERDANMICWQDLAASDKKTPVSFNQLASIIYTSGTTGQPKGAMMSNENFLSNVDACQQRVKILNTDKFLSFLPLSHVLERTCSSYIPLLQGASISYAESIKTLSEDLEAVKPTILICVPKIFENFHEKIKVSIGTKPALIKKIFFASLKRDCYPWLKVIAEIFIYKKIRQSLGGNLRFAVSGGASIQEKIIRFFDRIGVRIVEGYGLTETSPIICVNAIDNVRIGTVGQPLPGVEVKIAADKELLTKSRCVMLGYWQSPELTAEVLDDGWFKTGDLGFQDKDGYITIIGRKKEIIVASNGKNVAPERIEGIFNLSPYIFQSLVVGHRRPFLTALIVPDREVIGAEKFNDKKHLRQMIDKEIEQINTKLMSHERIKKYVLLNEPFTIEAEELTPTLKVRRKIIEDKHSREIESIYRN